MTTGGLIKLINWVQQTQNPSLDSSIQKLHHCICESVVCTMQKKIMNTPNAFSVMKENMPLLVVLKHEIE